MLIEGAIAKGHDIGKIGHFRYIYAACSECGNPRWVALARHKRNPRICQKCSDFKKGLKRRIAFMGQGNPAWKDCGRYELGSGYVDLLLRPDNFFLAMANCKRRVKEHRFVMAEHLGRCLQTWEIVHHKNGIRDDNRIVNLQLVSDLGHKQLTFLEKKIDKQSEMIDELRKEIRLLRLQLKESIPVRFQ